MVQLLSISLFIISVVVGAYIAILLNKQYQSNKKSYVQSFFYYQLLLIVFGIYGIVGSVILSDFLLKYEVELGVILKAISFIFYMAYPILIVAIYMLIKMCIELLGKTVRIFWTIAFFFIAVVSSFLLIFFIDELIVQFNYHYLISPKHYIFIGFELFVISFLSYFLIRSFTIKPYRKSKSYFLLSLIVIHVFIPAIYILSNYYFTARIYFLPVYFAGNFVFILFPDIFDSSVKIIGQPSEDDKYLLYNITRREKEIILEICAGKANKEISESLFITLQTVKDHTYNIFQKTGVKNRVQLRNLFSS